MTNSSKSILVIVFSFFGIIIFTFLLFSILLYPNKSSTKYYENTFYISHFDTKSNETSFGYVKIPSKILENKEFITFRSKNNEIFSVISSKFSTEKFECYGTCLCNNQDRRNINILSKSAYFIISAFSLSIAIKIASSYFSEECRNKCSSENIETEIYFCESSKNEIIEEYDYDPITGDFVPKKTIEKKTETNEIEKEGEYKGMEREYHCEGHCSPNGILQREEEKYESEKFECEKYTQEGRVTIIETGFLDDEPLKGHIRAKVKFMSEYLSPYCRSISKYRYEYVYTNPTSGKGEVKQEKADLCVGRNSGTNVFGNICCNLLNPFTGMEGSSEKQTIIGEDINTKV